MYARPGIPDRDEHVIGSVRRRDNRQFAQGLITVTHGLHCIQDQVEDHLLHLGPVRPRSGQASGKLRPSNLGPVALVVREQATVGAAMEALGRYIHIHNESVRLRIERRGNLVSVAPVLLLGRPVPARQSAELLMGITYRILSTFLGAGWRPLDVHFTFPAPRDRSTYRRFFNCNVAFGAESDAIICPAIDMERPMAAADASMARYAESFVEAIAARSPTIEGKVGELIAALLPTGRCSLDRVAQHLGCEGRTVQRWLAERGSSFSEILDAQRSVMVVRLIEDQSRSLPAVAELLGFSAQSALARWFRERFGCSITQWRADPRHRVVVQKAGLI